MLRDVGYVLEKLDWMRAGRIWPNGPRYLWTDAFGVVLYISLYYELGEGRWVDEAERLVADVERVLGRPRGLRIGEAADRDGQSFHYLALDPEGGTPDIMARLSSPSFRLHVLDSDFLFGDLVRGVRFLLEYAKAESLAGRRRALHDRRVRSARVREDGPPHHARWYAQARAFGRSISENGGASCPTEVCATIL